MILLKHLLLEINWNDYNIAMRGKDFDPLKPGEFELIKQKILDPKTSDVTKEKLKTKVVNSYMRLLPTWYTETGARGNGVPVDDFISLSYDAMLRAMKKFNWEAENQFGFLLGAFEYGAPPHGGIAFGFDRLCAVLNGQNSIRDFIAFPKNNQGRDMMIDAPSEIASAQLDELALKLNVK